jgi:TRAP-type C4-dicarboxylate transport system substrate-binding protein
MKVKRLLLLVGSICLVLVFASLSLIAEKALAQPKTYNWKMTSPMPAGNIQNRSIIDFAKTLEQRTNGAVKITIYESTLGAPTDQWDMVKTNTIQFAYTHDGYNAGRMPVYFLFGLPFELTDMNAVFNVANDWLKAGYLKELTDNFKVLHFMPTNLLQLIMRTKKVATMDDFKGLKIRSGTGLQGQTLSALGATGVSMAGGEVYMALQTGVIDGAITGIDVVNDRKLYEVAKYALRLPLYGACFALLMNKEVWNDLPKDLQTLVEQVSRDAANVDLKKRTDEENSLWERIRQLGVDIYNISPQEEARWKKVTAGIADKYVSDIVAKGHPAKEALELMRKVVGKK